MEDAVITLRNVWVRYNESVILEDVSLTVERGEILSIVGPNGSGKSTLLRAIMGFKPPFRGTVSVLGGEPQRVPRGSIGYLPQKSADDFTMPVSVFDVVAMARYAGKGFFERLSGEDRAIIDRSLEAVEIADLRKRHFGSLSGGQKQRALIARAIAVRPKILLLDEPSTGLDALAQDNFYQMLLSLRDSMGLTIVMVSHDIGAVSKIVDRLACLKTRIHFHGSPTDCFANKSLADVFGKNMYYINHDHGHGRGGHGNGDRP
ncbi:MAG: metal ABC transporter ATP-binding protein [Spirochaetes bacterium]|nr:metal ABC transporter ATP-binding protein [Spirochaetota bacterium]